jgi:sugar/nucleoside kinase (ribokinase family)
MSGPASDFDYVTIGHVTLDVIADAPDGPRTQPGGGAFYSALQAARLGLRTLIVTQGVAQEIRTLLAPYERELELYVIDAERTTTLHTSGAGSRREQRLLAWAGAIERLPTLNARIVHLAPVARETPTRLPGRHEFVGITPQGLIRQWQAGQGPTPAGAAGAPIAPVALERAQLPASFQAAVVSATEREHCPALFDAAEHLEAVVAVTDGERATTVFTPEPLLTDPPPALTATDDLGAGDVFAGAFFTRLYEGKSPLAAATFANAAAATRVGGHGPAALANRAQVEALLRRDAGR